MVLYITGFYAAAIALLTLFLSLSVSALRAKTGISILHGENIALAERIRRHGNLVESAPLVLILMGVAELGGAPALWLYVAGTALLAGRILHPIGLSAARPKSPVRIAGGMLTTAAILVCIVLIALPRFTA